MQVLASPSVSNPSLSSPTRTQFTASEGDAVRLGERPEAGPKPPWIKSKAEITGEQARPMSSWARGISLVLVGAIGAGALAGCSKPPEPPPVSETQTQAQQALDKAFDEADQLLQQNKDDDAKEQATRRVMSAVGEYARQTGRSAQQVASDLRGYMVEHPVLTLSVAYAVGVGAGIGLEKLGLSDSVSTSVESIKQAIKDHPILTGVVVVAAAAAVGYVIYEAVQTEATPVPPPPSTPEAEKLRSEFEALEQQAAQSTGNTREDAARIDRSLKEKIADYARSTGRSVEQVGSEIQQFYIDNPGVSAAVVLAAGVGTGVVLERAGVPATVARAASVALNSSKDGLAGVGEAIKEHPVLATAVGIGVAAGAGYLIHQAVTK